MTEQEERLAAVSARECAGWSSPPSVPVWVVTPDLMTSFDEVLFKEMADALEYIQENIADKIECDYTEEELAKDGFTLRLWRKLISQEQFDAVFIRGEWAEVKE